MTVEKILEQFDALKSNELGDTVKIGWLAEVEGRVLCQILGKSPSEVALPKGSGDALTLPECFSRVYLLYLAAMTALYGGDVDIYSSLKREFEEELSNYAKFVIKNR